MTRGAAELLADFVRDHDVPANRFASGAITGILLDNAKYPRAKVDSLLAGLEQLALHAPDPLVRIDAAAQLDMAGNRLSPRPLPGTAALLKRAYEASSDSAVKEILLLGMARIAERREAASFVRHLAMKSGRERAYPGEVHDALRALLYMDEEGRIVLRELYERRLVRDAEEARNLEGLAERGFRMQPPPVSP